MASLSGASSEALVRAPGSNQTVGVERRWHVRGAIRTSAVGISLSDLPCVRGKVTTDIQIYLKYILHNYAIHIMHQSIYANNKA